MKIGIDTNILLIDKAGAGVYTQELINHLRNADKINSYEFFSYGSEIFGRRKSFDSRIENVIRDTIWTQVLLPRRLKNKKIDLLHCTAYKAPIKCRVPLIVTFYDMHILKNPDDYTQWFKYYCKFMLRPIAKASAKIITISQFSREDILKTMALPEKKVAVTYCGINAGFRLITDAALKDKIRGKYGLNRQFIFYAGAIQPRKNIPALLNAFHYLKRNKLTDFQLVFTGGTGWQNKNIFILIDELNLKNDIKFLGYVPQEDLPVIYNLAEFAVYPSFFEGFGLPALEAMACGCPVITSNTSSLPEVVGDAGIMINPYRPGELEDAMKNLSANNTLKNELREKGLKRSRLFSWEKCARETLAIYEEIFSR